MRNAPIVALAVTLVAAVASAQEPPRPQAATPDQPRTESAAVPAPIDVAEGAKLFGTLCGFCHQDGGRVAGRGPKLAGTERPDDYVLNRIRVGKDGAMPAYGRAFSDAQLRSLLAYIRSLKDDAR